MASTRSWQCQLCTSFYVCLFDLVSHVRAAHSADCHLNFVCQVNGCPRMFTKTNTWYKHVRDEHQEEYCKRCPEIPAPTFHPPEGQYGAEMDSRNSDQEEDITSSTLDTPLIGHAHAPTIVTQDVAAGLLLKLTERHRLSQAAVDEVVKMVSTVSDHMVIEALTAVWQSGEAHGIGHEFSILPGFT